MDRFFIQRYCDRCKEELAGIRTISLLNSQCICYKCSEKELSLEIHNLAAGVNALKIRTGNRRVSRMKNKLQHMQLNHIVHE